MPLELLAPEQVANHREEIVKSLADRLIKSERVPRNQSEDIANQRLDYLWTVHDNFYFAAGDDIVWLSSEQPGQLALMLPSEESLADAVLHEIESWAVANGFDSLAINLYDMIRRLRFEQNGYIMTNALMEKQIESTPTSTLTLQPMGPERFDNFLENLIVDYGQDKLKAGHFKKDTWLEESRSQIMEIVPQGLETPDHFMFTLHNSDDEDVGHLWIARRPFGDTPDFWIYDIEMKEAYRRKGYGTQALLALEAFTKNEGLDRIGLHVFGPNHEARALYEKMGYDTILLIMKKSLGEGNH